MVQRSGSIPGMKNSLALNRGSPKGFNRTKPSVLTEQPSASVDVDLVCIIATWFDADIIEANIRACFAHGASRVIIIDNDSPDNSVEVAKAAGAEIGLVYATEYYDDDLRIRHVNSIAKQVVEGSKKPTWIMSLDADEIIAHQSGKRIIEVLSMQHPEVRTIGSNGIDIYPHSENWYTVGSHPALQAVHGCRRFETRDACCSLGHWKHIALRYDGVFDMAQTRGNHIPALNGLKRVNESTEEIYLFHVPLRNRETMTARLDALCGGGARRRSAGDDEVTINKGAILRYKSLDAIYSGRWNEVQMPHGNKFGREVVGIVPYPVSTICPWIMNDAGVRQ